MILTDKELNKIKEFIEKELLKRGFTAPITLIEKDNKLILLSEKFQTTPVLFSTINLCEFSSGVKLVPHKEYYGGDVEEKIKRFWIQVYVYYEHFGGGYNTTSLFFVEGAIVRGVLDAKVN